MSRAPELPRVKDVKRDLDVLLAMLVRADIGFVLNQSGPVTTVELVVEKPTPVGRPVFTFTKVGGALRGVVLDGVTDL